MSVGRAQIAVTLPLCIVGCPLISVGHLGYLAMKKTGLDIQGCVSEGLSEGSSEILRLRVDPLGQKDYALDYVHQDYVQVLDYVLQGYAQGCVQGYLQMIIHLDLDEDFHVNLNADLDED